jgi:hypothetical protein
MGNLLLHKPEEQGSCQPLRQKTDACGARSGQPAPADGKRLPLAARVGAALRRRSRFAGAFAPA